MVACMALLLGAAEAVPAVPVGAAAPPRIPANCAALRPDVSKYLAKVSRATLEPPALAGALVCDFTFVDGAPMAVVHLIVGESVAQLMEAGAYAQVNGYQTEAVPGLGKASFSIARAHKPWGLMALSAPGVLYQVKAPFSFAKDIVLVRALIQLKPSADWAAPQGGPSPMHGESTPTRTSTSLR